LFLSPQSPLLFLLVLRQFPLIGVHGVYCPMQLLKACQGLSSQEPCRAAAALHLAIHNLRSTSQHHLQGLSYIACCASHCQRVFPDGHLASPAPEQCHSALCSKQVLDYLCTSATEVPLYQHIHSFFAPALVKVPTVALVKVPTLVIVLCRSVGQLHP